MARIAILAAFATTVVTANIAAQARDTLPIDTDRPDFTDGVHTVTRGRQQLELGYTYQRARGSGAGYFHSLPEALLRAGIAEKVEVRIGENFLVQNDGSGAGSSSGFDDLYLGTKMSLTEAHGLVPALAVEAKVNLPTGAARIGAGRVLPGAALLFGWEGDGPWSAGVEAYVTATADRQGSGVASLSVQYQFSARWQMFGEIIAEHTLQGAAVSTQYGNAGILFLITRDVQVDARVGAGLNQDADRYFVGFGFSIRR
jgi:Putative MetA-pathway of phenol degradation